VSGGTVYVGGEFTNIGRQARNRVAALNASTGLATSWNPSASGGSVYTLAVSGGIVYAGGSFTGIGGQARNRIAALNPSTGAATSWNPNASGCSGSTHCVTRISALAVSGSIVYAGGEFTNIGGQQRSNIAALDVSTGAATSWNPGTGTSAPLTSFGVSALAVSGGIVYAGGSFTAIGGVERNHIAALDASTGLATSWNPNASDFVNTLAVSGGIVYAGGTFTAIGGVERNHIAALDPSTG